MSEHAPPSTAAGEPVTLEAGLEALQTSPEFGGPVEHLDGHHCNDHFAQIYETDAERFDAAVPFVRHGLEADERVLYVIDKSSDAEVRAALQAGGIDVDAAIDSGQLSFHTVQDTYLRNDSFDPDEMIEFYADTVAEATAEYEALRIVAETTWLQSDATSVEQFMEYESKVNQLFADEDCLAICQYDRDAFPPAVVRNIVQTHPHLIYDGTVCHNVYYTPPAEFFADDDPRREVDRMLGTLRERTEAKAEVARHDRFLRHLYEITASQDRSFEEKLDAVFDLGCEVFDLDFGFLNRVDPAADHLEIEHASGDHEHYEVGDELPLSETYCQATVDIEAAASIADPAAEGYDDLFVYEEFGVDGYLGTYIPVDGGADRTLAFVPAADAQSVSITETDRAYLELMGQWVGYELNRRQREQFLRECHEITADPARGFDEKLDALFDLGCDHFDMELGAIARVDPETDWFEIERTSADHEHFEPGLELELSETYCTAATDADAPAGVTAPEQEGYDDITVREEFGLESYLGTHLTPATDADRTFFFVRSEPRDREVTELERTFVDLMAQWVESELERRQREQFLRECHEITADPDHGFEAKLERLVELGCKRFGLDAGGLCRVDRDSDFLEVETVIGDHDVLEPGLQADLSETYCQVPAATGAEADTAVSDPDDVTDPERFEGTLGYEVFGIRTYLGTHLELDGAPNRTFWLVSNEPRDDPITDEERMFHRLMGQWVRYELERQQHEQYQRELYEIAADSDRSFEEKLDAVFDLGRERFGLDIGGMAKVDSDTDLFEVEAVTGDHDHLVPGARYPLSETYCRLVTEDGDTAAVTAPVDAGFEGRLCYEQFGVQTYLGTHIDVDGDTNRTFWFLSNESRDTPITDEEHTFVDLMGQWVKYELERRQRERELERTKTRFKTVFEQSNDAIFLIAPDADALVDANPAAAEMLGYTRDELLSRSPSDLHPDELEQFHAFLDEVREHGSAWTEDLHCRHRDGRDLPSEVSASAITLDGRELVLANVRHIEERKKHERYQRELYDIVADSDALFDAKVERLLELGRERFGLENGYFNRIDADEFEVVAAVGPHDLIEAGAADSLAGTYCETHLESSDPLAAADVGDAGLDDLPVHETYGLEAYFAATVHVGGEEYGTLCFASETPRERPFTEAERTFLDLMAQCMSYELERNHREAQLERKNDRLESFASLLAHELRNPVTIGQIYSQQLPAETDAEAVEYVTDAFDRIEDMVDVLLILTRGREAIDERTSVDFADVARKAWDTVDAPDAALDVEFDRTIEADETYVRHLFRNLLENAVEHAGEDVSVTVGDLPTGFYVADDGPGIPPEDREAVFDEGYTTAADNGGTGLGLAFVRKLAEVYEWDYAVTESADGGARFEFRNVT